MKTDKAGLQWQVRLSKRPNGLPGAETWSIEQGPIPALSDGKVLVKILYLSIDPAMRGWLNDVRSYVPPVKVGAVMRALGVGEVLESQDEGFAVGDLVTGLFGWQEFAAVAGKDLNKCQRTIAPPSHWLGVLGMTGLTAYFGLLDVGKPKEGETILVSGAAGAVGSIVGQIAKIKGCRTVGIAGGPAKCARLVEEFGYDAAIDYKAGNLAKALKESCPDGVDVFFDNVGGEILDAALRRIRLGARIVVCGAISTYNASAPTPGPTNYLSLLVNRARMEGFIVFDYAQRYPAAIRELVGWIAEGRIKHREEVVVGLDKAPEALLMLFEGTNQGKVVVKVAQ